MVLAALFTNFIGSIYGLEAYIKSDIIKHGVNLSKMLQTLEELVGCCMLQGLELLLR